MRIYSVASRSSSTLQRGNLSTAVDTGTVFRAVTANDATGAEDFVAIKVVSIAGKGPLRAARSVRLGPSPECIPTRPQSRWEWAFPLTLGRPQT